MSSQVSGRLRAAAFPRFGGHLVAHQRLRNILVSTEDMVRQFRGYLADSVKQGLGSLEETGGEGGIRTPEGLAPLPVFETGPFNRSGTSPDWDRQRWRRSAAAAKKFPQEFAAFRG